MEQKPEVKAAQTVNVMSMKYCDHNTTHGCTAMILPTQSLCTDCARGLC